MLFLHIFLAVISSLLVVITALLPTQTKIRLSYTSSGLTLVSGFLLGLTRPMHLSQVCAGALLFLLLVATCLTLAHKRLAQVEN